MRQPHLVLLWCLGVFCDLEHRDVVVIILKAEEDTKTLAFIGDLHPENVPVEAFRRLQIAHLDHHVSDSLDRHTPPPAKRDHFGMTIATGVLYWHKRRKSQPIMQGYTVLDDTFLQTARP